MTANFIFAKEICFATYGNSQKIVIEITNARANFIFVGENPVDFRQSDLNMLFVSKDVSEWKRYICRFNL
ncbi:hypothetical protein SD074_03800 [Prolixibacter sp. SD074]|nr:hypothetical protein SD074_03800 [Prolixibacter sp. SD074]